MNESKLALGLRDRAIAHGGDALLLDAAADIERLTAQRDTLLEALEVVLNDLMYRDHAEVINFARAAIKSVKAEPAQEPEWEVRADGKRVRTDRWQIGIRRIVALLWGNQREFEIDELVEAVHRLHAQRDALLKALKLIDKEFKKDGRHHWPEAVKARAAIKSVEE